MIAALTSSRADWPKLWPLVRALAAEEPVVVLAGGDHLDPSRGKTIEHVLDDCEGVRGVHCVQLGEDLLQSACEAVAALRPRALLAHGDRLEVVLVASAASAFDVPVIHIEGGESSGSRDDMIRHALSGLAADHLVADEAAAARLRERGAAPERIHVVGSAELDDLEHHCLAEPDPQWHRLLGDDYAIVLLHPDTSDSAEVTAARAIALRRALERLERPALWLSPSSEPGWEEIAGERWSARRPVIAGTSLRYEVFAPLLARASLLVGNSSSGHHLAPVLGTPCLELGDRQRGRGAYPVHVADDEDAIYWALIEHWGKRRAPSPQHRGGAGCAERVLGLYRRGRLHLRPAAP